MKQTHEDIGDGEAREPIVHEPILPNRDLATHANRLIQEYKEVIGADADFQRSLVGAYFSVIPGEQVSSATRAQVFERRGLLRKVQYLVYPDNSGHELYVKTYIDKNGSYTIDRLRAIWSTGEDNNLSSGYIGHIDSEIPDNSAVLTQTAVDKVQASIAGF